MNPFTLFSALLMAQAPLAEPAPAVGTDRFALSEPVAEQPAEPEPETSSIDTPDSDEGEIVVTGRARTPADPLASINAESFAVVQSADRAIVAPLAYGYRDAVPSPLRRGLSNFLQNLREPIAILNSLLQLKIGRAFETLGRFAINSTVGIGGVLDVAASPAINLPRRPNGFANTLGFYGVRPGAFLFLPLVGATTVRDLIGGTIDGLLYPIAIGRPFTQLEVTVPVGAVSALDYRIQHDGELRDFTEETNDPYVALRDHYLNRRQAEIDALRGRAAPSLPTAPSTETGPAPAADGNAPAPAAVPPEGAMGHL